MKDANDGSTRKPAGLPRNASARVGSVELLMATAERLFAERGIDAVSLREIGREAGQRNNSALLYHFNSKQELIHRILRAGVAAVDVQRNAFLDRIEAEGGPADVRAVVEAIVLPLVAGRQSKYYVRFLANAQMSRELDLADITREEGVRGFDRIYRHLNALLPGIPGSVLRQRFLAAISFVMFGLADLERLDSIRKGRRQSFDKARAIDNLVDMLAGALAAPVSKSVQERIDR
jgi:AcrR family transcriptional regulator